MNFEEAQKAVNDLSERPDNGTLLKLYAFFKQASSGDVKGDRPGMFDMKGRAKFDAWEEVEGLSQEAASEKYVALVQQLLDDDE